MEVDVKMLYLADGYRVEVTRRKIRSTEDKPWEEATAQYLLFAPGVKDPVCLFSVDANFAKFADVFQYHDRKDETRFVITS